MFDFLKEIELPFKIPTPDKTIRIAVTGLSGSGKTVFLTSLINQLLAGDKLSYMKEKIDRPFVARILPPDNLFIRFDYYSKLKAFREATPHWPKATRSVTKTTLQLEFKSEYRLLENQIVNLELIDYPGEWLMDLSMLGLSYEAWSHQMFDLSRNPKRYPYARSWLDDLEHRDLYGASSRQEDLVVHDLYREYLKKLHYNAFSFVQPGRFLEPGDLEGDPILLFAPLPPPKNRDFHPDSIYARFQRRFDAYLKEVVERLYLEHFQRFDTQIVLVDLIKTLQYGYDAFLDMHLAFRHILKSFTYGTNPFFFKLFGLKIDHVIFAATKADYIPPSQYNSYQRLLKEMIMDIKRELLLSHIESEVTIFSSVKSTDYVKAKVDGKVVECIRGVVEGEQEPSIHFPGILPQHYKRNHFWKEAKFDFPRFSPRPFPPSDNEAVEHIRMDRLIYTLLRRRV